jgi:hypothetical protein
MMMGSGLGYKCLTPLLTIFLRRCPLFFYGKKLHLMVYKKYHKFINDFFLSLVPPPIKMAATIYHKMLFFSIKKQGASSKKYC